MILDYISIYKVSFFPTSLYKPKLPILSNKYTFITLTLNKNKKTKTNNMPASTNSQLTKLKELMTCVVPTQFYPNQTSAAKEILDNFASDTRYMMLSAQMQSGKTGCAFYVMFDMLISGKIDKVFIMSGSSETSLSEQWRKKYTIHLANFCQTLGWTYRKDKKRVEEIGNKIETGIVWRQDLLKKSDLFNI